MNFTKLAFAAALATATVAVPGAAFAQDAAVEVTAGATFYGNDGAPIGTIKEIVDDGAGGKVAIIDVDGLTAPVPVAQFGTGDQGLMVNATKAQVSGMLMAQKQQAEAARDAALVVGADVATVKGVPIGAVKSIDGDNVIVAHGDSDVALTRSQFAIVDQKLVAMVVMEDIMAAIGAN